MTPPTFDATVADWLREGPESGPRHGLDRALAATHRVEQRPAWVFPRRYLPRPIFGLLASSSSFAIRSLRPLSAIGTGAVGLRVF